MPSLSPSSFSSTLSLPAPLTLLFLCLSLSLVFVTVAQPTPSPSPVSPSPSPSPSGAVTALADDTVLRIGIVSTLYRDADQTDKSKQLDIAYKLWAENANKKNDGKGLPMNGKFFQVELVWSESGDPLSEDFTDEERAVYIEQYTSRVKDAALALCSGSMGRIDFMIAAYSSTYAAEIGETCDSYPVPIVTGNASGENVYRCSAPLSDYPTCLSLNQRRFKWSISVDSQAKNYFPQYVSLMKIRGVESLSVFYEAESFPTYSAVGIRDAAAQLDIPILMDVQLSVHRGNGYLESPFANLPTNNNPLSAELRQELSDLVDDLIFHDADAIAGGTYASLCRNLLISFKERNYFPKSLALNSCLTETTLADIPTLAPYVYGPSAWDPRLSGYSYSESANNPVYDFPSTSQNSTAELFLDAFTAHPDWQSEFASTRSLPIYQAVGGYVCGYAIAETARLAESFDPESWLTNWYSITLETVYGPIKLDNVGHNEAKLYLILQVNDKGVFNIAAPLSSATAETIYPAPYWDERIFDDTAFSNPVQWPFMIGIGVLVVILIVFMIILFTWRKRPQILAASFLFCEIICFGSLLSYVSLFMWGMYTSTVLCNLQLWLFVIGFDLFLGALLVKNWKIQKIFKAAKHLKKTSIDDSMLFYAILTVLSFDVVVLVIWQAGFPIIAEVYQPDPIRASTSYFQCTTTSRSATAAFDPVAVEKVFTAILGVYKLFQIAVGSFLAHRLRNTPTEFNEARYIGFALYNLLFCIIVLFIVWLVVPRELLLLSYILRMVVSLWAITFSLLAIFVPKIYFIMTKSEKKQRIATVDFDSFADPSGVSSDMRSSDSLDTNGFNIGGSNRLENQVVELRSQLEAAQETIRRLKAQRDSEASTSSLSSSPKPVVSHRSSPGLINSRQLKSNRTSRMNSQKNSSATTPSSTNSPRESSPTDSSSSFSSSSGMSSLTETSSLTSSEQ